MGLEKGTSKFAYSGTLKYSTCTRCGANLNNKTRLEQDEHVIECIKQQKLF